MPHDGYESWPFDDKKYPFPVDELQATNVSETAAAASCDVRFPPAAPFEKAEAERSVGIARAWRFTVAIRSEKKPGGIESQIRCTARHMTWFPKHGETGLGGLLEFEIPQATVALKPRDSLTKDYAHGPHFDRVTVYYSLIGGSVLVQFLAFHREFGKIGVPDMPVDVTPKVPGPSEKPSPTLPPEDDLKPKPEDVGPLAKRARLTPVRGAKGKGGMGRRLPRTAARG